MSKILITGASRGLGKALAAGFSRNNHCVIATARNINDLNELNVHKKIKLNVTNDEHIGNAVDECGDIDILINNAAYTVAGPIEAIPIEEIKKEYGTNVIGPLKLIRAFIPGMRKKGKGTIVNISSAADRFAPPYGGSYSSAKAALAMMSEALHFEVKHFGIKVVLVECGSIKTGMPEKQKKYSSDEYEQLDKQMKIRMEEFFKQDNRPEPGIIAKIIIDAIENPETGFRVTAGQDAEYMISQRLKLNDSEWFESPMYKGLDW